MPDGLGQNPTPKEITRFTLDLIATHTADPRYRRNRLSGKLEDQLIEIPDGQESGVQVEQSPVNGPDQNEGTRTKKGRVRYNLLSYILHLRAETLD